MKKLLFVFALFLSMTQLWSQDMNSSATSSKSEENRNFRIPLIGEKAPSFTAESTNGTITFPDDFGRKWKILFSHPADYTPVCSSEILELAHLQKEFDKLGVKLVVVSTDPLATHNQWKKALEDLEYKGRTKASIKFPLVDDDKLVVSKQYGMIHPKSNTTKDVRGVFIIDPADVVRAIYFYPMEVGRSTDELIRTITALQTADKGGIMTPADWKAGNDVLVPYNPAVDPTRPETVPEGYYQTAWFMWYKKAAY